MLRSCGLWGHFYLVGVMISRVPGLACVRPWLLQERDGELCSHGHESSFVLL